MTSLRAGPPRRAAGFTLLELIVAVGILALIAVFSWRGLDALIREREALAASQRTIDAMQRLFARVERDALAASDVELTGDGTMLLLAGSSALDGGAAAAVRYRYVEGMLQRTVAGVDRSPATVLGDVGGMTLEAWSPTPAGGTWVRSRQVAPPPAVAPVAPVAPAASQNVVPAGVPVVLPVAVPTAAPATAIRLAFTRADGPPVTRTFLVGGG